jgi:short-subunit dehydrogenase
VLPYLGIYHLTKFALEAAFDALRMELAPRGIQVSMVEPGLIYTGFNEEMAATKYRWLKPTSFFKDDLPKMKVHDASITPSSHPTDSVVKAIVHAVCARRPKIRYTVPVRYAILVFLAKFLPDRLKDSVMRKFAGL